MPNPLWLWRESHTCLNVCMACVRVAILDCHACMQFKVVRCFFHMFCFFFMMCELYSLTISFSFSITTFQMFKMGRGKKTTATYISYYSLEYTFPSRTKNQRFTQWPRNQWKCLCTIDKVERRKEHRHVWKGNWFKRKKSVAIVSTYVTVTKPCLHSSPKNWNEDAQKHKCN